MDKVTQTTAQALNTIAAQNDAREQRFAIAEGLLNHIENHLMLHGNNKLRMGLIDDISRNLFRQYIAGWNDAIAQMNTQVKADPC